MQNQNPNPVLVLVPNGLPPMGNQANPVGGGPGNPVGGGPGNPVGGGGPGNPVGGGVPAPPVGGGLAGLGQVNANQNNFQALEAWAASGALPPNGYYDGEGRLLMGRPPVLGLDVTDNFGN